MYKDINKKITISTRRNKTESNYVSKFIDCCEVIKDVDNLLDVIYKLNSHKDIWRFNHKIRKGGKWVSGSIYSIQISIYNNAFKIPIVIFSEKYNPNEMTEEESIGYIDYLSREISNFTVA